jgi:hypothetical protein
MDYTGVVACFLVFAATKAPEIIRPPRVPSFYENTK